MKKNKISSFFVEEESRPANQEFLKRRHQQLLKSETAIKELDSYGLSLNTVKKYKLGLSDLRIDRSGITRGNALLAPVQNENGEFVSKTIYINLPSVTINPSTDQWTKGLSVTYYSGARLNQKVIFVCGSLFDLWLTVQNISDKEVTNDKILFICSSHKVISPATVPSQWRDPAFWSRFERVFSCFSANDEGDRKNDVLSQFAGGRVSQFFPPLRYGTTWSDFWRNGGKTLEFKKLLSEVCSLNLETTVSNDPEGGDSESENEPARSAFNPLDISTGYFNGFLHYPVNTLVSKYEDVRDATGKTTSRKTYKTETVIVRSDRTIHKVMEEPAPRGTPRQERIYRLTDGTVVDSQPAAPKNATWSWDSIDRFLRRRAPPARPLGQILDDVNCFLRSAVRLSCCRDYDILTLLVPVTYAQAIFSAVPIILICGVAGSGKTTLGRAMADVSANSAIIGQATVASAAREIHESRGLIVLDDLESIGPAKNKNGKKSGEFEQMLKVSYKQNTGWRQVTDMRNGMKNKKYNLFGVKIISNTTGSDSVLASRMIEINTGKISDLSQNHFVESSSDLRSFGDQFLKNIRDELHTWVFENAELIAETYRRLFPVFADREAEITAPLKVFAELCVDGGMTERLDDALNCKNRNLNIRIDDSTELVRSAAGMLALRGIRDVSATSVLLEISEIRSRNPHLSHSGKSFNELTAAVVGKIMRQLGIIEDGSASKRIMKDGKFLRIYQFSDKFIRSISGNTSN